MRNNKKTLSLEDLTAHQQRIRSIVQKINQYSPSFHLNLNYNRQRILQQIRFSRQCTNQFKKEHQDKLFQQNIKIIERLQSVQPKIDLKHFPTVNLIARSKRKCSSLSERKLKPARTVRKYMIKDQDTIFEQNLDMIQKIQQTSKKVKCWQNKSLAKSRVIKQKQQAQKRNAILQKFKQISQQLKSLKIKKIVQNSNQKSPYLTQKQKRQTCQTYFQTKNNSIKKRMV